MSIKRPADAMFLGDRVAIDNIGDIHIAMKVRRPEIPVYALAADGSYVTIDFQMSVDVKDKPVLLIVRRQ